MKNVFGVIAVFDTPERVKNAAARLREAGFRAFEAYTPYPIEELNQIIHPGPRLFLPLLMFGAALLGAAWGYWIQYWDEALNYPINVGGRPYNSWPAFMVGTFEFMLLVTVAAGFFGMLAASRLPKLYHPIFEARSFARASRDRFLICVEARDPRFDAASINTLFEQLGAERIEEVRA
ncbi:MAG TPA: DUF3341 domain-containing protein [Xanthobacteraceae bacterium]|jgi:hypothetical protein